jgi:hypothetical protein
MEQSTSFISDLPPENITYQLSGVETKLKKEPLNPPSYAPLDVHKNPYLAEPGQGQQQLQGQGSIPPYPQVTSLKPQPPNPLPSRDIPQNPGQYQDIEAQPNYVPKPKMTRDFVRENDELTEQRLKDRKRKKQKEQIWKLSWEQLQIPLLLAVLFFVFQLPWLQSLLYKYVTFVPLFHADGIINHYGLAVKAGLFGLAFYLLTKFTDIAAIPPVTRDETVTGDYDDDF